MKAGPVVTDNGCVSLSPPSLLPPTLTLFPFNSNFVIDAVFSEPYMRDPAELLHRIKMCALPPLPLLFEQRLTSWLLPFVPLAQAHRCSRGGTLLQHG